MNVYLRELKAHRWGLLFWSIGMVMLLASGMAKYAAYEAAGESVVDMINQIPKGLQAVFGFTGFDLTTAAGFYGVLFLYIAVMGAIHAALLGAGLISKEERDRTSEFLYTKPASRSRLLTGKLLAGLTNVLAFNLVTAAASFYFVDYYNKDAPFGGAITRLMIGLLLLQLIFFSIGALIAGTTHTPKRAPSRATSIMFLTFLLSFIVSMNEHLDFLKYLTPFKYFDAATLMNDGFDPVFIVLSVAIVVLATLGAYRFYNARDLNV